MNKSERNPTVRETAAVHVSKPVSGNWRRRRTPLPESRSGRVTTSQVDPRVLAMAHRIQRPGTRLVLADTSTVLIVNQPIPRNA